MLGGMITKCGWCTCNPFVGQGLSPGSSSRSANSMSGSPKLEPRTRTPRHETHPPLHPTLPLHRLPLPPEGTRSDRPPRSLPMPPWHASAPPVPKLQAHVRSAPRHGLLPPAFVAGRLRHGDEAPGGGHAASLGRTRGLGVREHNLALAGSSSRARLGVRVGAPGRGPSGGVAARRAVRARELPAHTASLLGVGSVRTRKRSAGQ